MEVKSLARSIKEASGMAGCMMVVKIRGLLSS